ILKDESVVEAICQDGPFMIGRPVLSKTKDVLAVVIFTAWIEDKRKFCAGIGDRCLTTEKHSGYQKLVSSKMSSVNLSDDMKVDKSDEGGLFHWKTLEQFEIGLRHNYFDRYAADLTSYFNLITKKVK